jgi:hypothetical protein
MIDTERRRKYVLNILDKLALRLSVSAYLTLDPGTQQQRASSTRCSIQTRCAALQPSKRWRIRGSQANLAAFKLRKTEDDEEEDDDEEVELRIPGSFGFENIGGGAAQAAEGAGTVEAFEAVGVLGNLGSRL